MNTFCNALSCSRLQPNIEHEFIIDPCSSPVSVHIRIELDGFFLIEETLTENATLFGVVEEYNITLVQLPGHGIIFGVSSPGHFPEAREGRRRGVVPPWAPYKALVRGAMCPDNHAFQRFSAIYTTKYRSRVAHADQHRLYCSNKQTIMHGSDITLLLDTYLPPSSVYSLLLSLSFALSSFHLSH